MTADEFYPESDDVFELALSWINGNRIEVIDRIHNHPDAVQVAIDVYDELRRHDQLLAKVFRRRVVNRI